MHSFTYSLIHVFHKYIHTFEILSTKMWVRYVGTKWIQKHSAFVRETKYRGEKRSYGLVEGIYSPNKSMNFTWSI